MISSGRVKWAEDRRRDMMISAPARTTLIPGGKVREHDVQIAMRGKHLLRARVHCRREEELFLR